MTSPLDDYLATLPDGLRSIPEAKVKGNVLDEQLAWLRELALPTEPRFTAALHMAQPVGRSLEWVPEVLCNAISLHVRSAYDSDGAWCDAVLERQRRVFASPLYRALMVVLSPTLVTMGAEQRWAAFRRGSALKVEKWRRDGDTMTTHGVLTYPVGLHPPLLLRGIGSMLQAGIEAAGARQSRIELLDEGKEPGVARYRLTYRG